MGILGQGMEYFWIVAQLQKSNTTCIVHARKAMAMWKPILVFNKPPREMPPKAFCDTITGKKSKRYHPWEQSIHEALHLLTRFASPGDLVLDPFAGSGTIPLAAKLLGLRSVGIEIDADTWDTASQRMTQTPLDLFDYDCLEVQS
jgi:tRNA/tmRNA/rRNA uracil-C5-methylase (TrmA/RlmC/RlmD family)